MRQSGTIRPLVAIGGMLLFAGGVLPGGVLAGSGRATAGTVPVVPTGTTVASPSPDLSVLASLPDADGYLRAWAVSGALPWKPGAEPPDPGDPATWLDWRVVFGDPRANLLHVSALPGGADADADGWLDSKPNTAVFAAVDIHASMPVDAILHVAADDDATASLNGAPVVADTGPHAWSADRATAPVHLNAGVNHLLLRVGQVDGAWLFSARLTDLVGRPLPITLTVPGVNVPAHLAAIGQALVDESVVDTEVTLLTNGYGATVTVTPPPAVPGATPLLAETDGSETEHFGAPADFLLGPPYSMAGGPGPLATMDLVLHGPGGASRTVHLERPMHPDLASVALDAIAELATLRSTRPALFDAHAAPHLGAWEEKLAEAGGRKPGPPVTGLDSTGVATLEWLATTLKTSLEAGETDTPWLTRLAAQITAVLDPIRAGRDPFEGRTGQMLMAYRSRLDGTAQPFAIVVPSTFHGGTERKWRMHIGLHGLGSGPGRYIRELLGVPLKRYQSDHDAEHDYPTGVDLPDPTDFIVAPYGRGDVAYRGAGEDDVLSVLDTVLGRYPIARDQVDLTGVSMGGIGVFELSSHRPDIFQRALVLAGAADIRRFDSVRGKPVTQFEARVLASVAAVEWAENLWDLPMDCVHGKKDTAIDASNSALMMDRLAALSSPFKTFVKPMLGHDVQDATYANGAIWTTPLAPRNDNPEHVTVVSGDLQYRAQYWVRIDSAQRADQFARVDARRVSGAAPTRVEVTTANVDGFTLRLDAPADVVVDGKLVTRSARGFQAFAFSASKGFYRVALPHDTNPPGPIGGNHIQPRLFVYGTLDPSETVAEKAIAERLSNQPGIRGTKLPVEPDVAVTEDQLDAYDIVAVGSAAANALVARAEAAGRQHGTPFPVRFDAEGVSVDGAHASGDDVGAVFVIVNPLEPEHSLTVYEGGHEALDLSRCLPRYLPDYLVWDERIRCLDAGNILNGRGFVAGGFLPLPTITASETPAPPPSRIP